METLGLLAEEGKELLTLGVVTFTDGKVITSKRKSGGLEDRAYSAKQS